MEINKTCGYIAQISWGSKKRCLVIMAICRLKVNVHKCLTCSRICSATRSVLKILPTKGVKFLCHCMSCFLSISMPSSMSMAENFAALRHVELMDSIPDALRYSSTPCKDTSVPYSSATSLKLLWYHITGCHNEISENKKNSCKYKFN